MIMLIVSISSIITTLFLATNIFHLRLMTALKDNRDFIVYFAAATNPQTKVSLETFIYKRLRFDCWVYLFLYLVSLFLGIFSIIPVVISILLFFRDIQLYRPFWYVLFPRLCSAKYYPIQPPF